jgi:ribosome-associated protein
VTTEVSSAGLTQAAKNSVGSANLSRSQSQGDPKVIREFAIELARLSSELKCEQVVLIDVRGRNQLCEYLVIVSGTSDRQMKSVSDQLKAFGAQHGSPRWKRDRDTNGTWIAADFVDVVVHLFEPGQRAWYDLEGMWADAPRVEWRRNVPAKSAGESMPSKKHGEGKSALHMIAVEDVSRATMATAKSSTKKTPAKKSSTKKTTAKKISTKKTTAKKASTKKATVKKTSAKKPAAKKVASTKASSKSASAKSKKTAAQKSSSR